MSRVWSVFAAVAIVAAPVARAQTLDETTLRASTAALQDDTAWSLLESLTTEVGARPVGTPAMDKARDWGVAKLRALGFRNIHVERFTTPTWRREGMDVAEIVSPRPQRLHVLALGNSSTTPEAGITAPIMLFKSYQEMLAQPPGSLKGKIAVVTQPMTRTQDISGYVAASPQRRSGPAEAAARGAVGYLVRSLSTDDTQLPHTGGARAGGIPAGALSPPDAELLERLADRGTVSIKLRFASASNPETPAYNISGEIPGTTGEIVIVGGHLDSWDVGTGAVDDASGIAIAMAAAKLAAANQPRPRRTIRVVLWGSEEQSGSGAAYAKAHAGELSRIVLAGESDTGADRIFAVSLPKDSATHPAMRAFQAAMVPLRIPTLRSVAADGGSDVSEMVEAGVPTVALLQDLTRYMDLHHSDDDTLDKVDPRQLRQNVAAWTALLHAVAYGDIDFRKLAIAMAP